MDGSDSADSGPQDGSSGSTRFFTTATTTTPYPFCDDPSQPSRVTIPLGSSVPLVSPGSPLAARGLPAFCGDGADANGTASESTSGEPPRVFLAIPTRRVELTSAAIADAYDDEVDARVFSAVATPPRSHPISRAPSCMRICDLAFTPFEAMETATSAVFRGPPAALFSVVCGDVAASILTFCDDEALLQLAAVNQALRRFAVALDTVLWRPRCDALWAGKLVFDLSSRNKAAAASDGAPTGPAAPLPRARVPRKALRALLRATELAEPAPPPSLVHGLATNWRAAYFVSKKDARRDFLVDDELFEHHWAVQFVGRGPNGGPLAEAQPPGPRVFRRIGRIHVVQPAAFLPAVPCQLYDGGRRVQVDVFPTHKVERGPDWGWRIVNAFVRFETGRAAPRPAGRDVASSSDESRGLEPSAPPLPSTRNAAPAGSPTSALIHIAGSFPTGEASGSSDDDDGDDGDDGRDDRPPPTVVLRGASAVPIM